MPKLIPVISEEEIKEQISRVAKEISNDYEGKKPVLIGVLKGSFIFTADLSRSLSIPSQVDFVGASSYGANTSTSGEVAITKDVSLDIEGKDVLVLEDIVDTGLTLIKIIAYLKRFNPKSVKICALLNKHERRSADITVDYECFAIPKGFLVGYGLDYAEDYRNLPAIFNLEE